MQTRVRELLDRFPRVRLLVIGDAVLDAWMYAGCGRLAREAPVPVHEVDHVDWAPGSAANCAANAAALGAQVELAAIVGADESGERLRRILRDSGVDDSAIVVDSARSTTTKSRLVVDGQVMSRFDTEAHAGWSASALARLGDRTIERLEHVDAVLVADYGNGALTEGFIRRFCRERNRLRGPLVVDGHDFHRWDDCRVTAMTPSASEVNAPSAARTKAERVEHLTARSEELLREWHCDMLLTTVDSDGTLLHRWGRPPYRTRAVAHATQQTCGAGDTVSAAFALALAAGAEPEAAADLAQQAAGVVVDEPGTSCCTAAALLDRSRGLDDGLGVTSTSELREQVAAHRAAGRRIVFTNGCFDILHAGHVEYLRQARALGDVLVVALNSDASIRRLKGEDRPIVPEAERAGLLAALRSVDHVVLFDTESPRDLIELVRPDVYVKGGDYNVDMLPEAPLVERLGGEVVLVDYIGGRSTTQMVERIRGQGPTPVPVEGSR
jgi:rfaE bifunctional protein kinase chain/domain/rfaE bifunctional protein nucleotidyltransferase chain/domain